MRHDIELSPVQRKQLHMLVRQSADRAAPINVPADMSVRGAAFYLRTALKSPLSARYGMVRRIWCTEILRTDPATGAARRVALLIPADADPAAIPFQRRPAGRPRGSRTRSRKPAAATPDPLPDLRILATPLTLPARVRLLEAEVQALRDAIARLAALAVAASTSTNTSTSTSTSAADRPSENPSVAPTAD